MRTKRNESLFQITYGQNLDNKALSSGACGVDHISRLDYVLLISFWAQGQMSHMVCGKGESQKPRADLGRGTVKSWARPSQPAQQPHNFRLATNQNSLNGDSVGYSQIWRTCGTRRLRL